MARVVMVTGGSGALGQAITQRFLAEGAQVCVPYMVDQERERLEASVPREARARLRVERCDVLDDAAVERLVASVVEQHRRLDVLVSAVGGFAMGELVQTDRARWDRMLTLNLTSAYVAARAALPPMLTAGSGRIGTITYDEWGRTDGMLWRRRPRNCRRLGDPTERPFDGAPWP